MGRIFTEFDARGLAESTYFVHTSDQDDWLGERGLALEEPDAIRRLLNAGVIVKGPDPAVGAPAAIPAVFASVGMLGVQHPAEQIWVATAAHDFVRDLIHRAKAAGRSALLVTMDLSMLGQRHKGREKPPFDPARLAQLDPHRGKARMGAGDRGDAVQELWQRDRPREGR